MNPSPAAPPLLELIEFCLAEYGRIRQVDEDLENLSLRYADRRGADAIRRQYKQWVAQAEGVLERVRSRGERKQLGDEYEKLEDAVGRTQAMLSITLDSLERADEQIRNGQAVSIEEVRRELLALAPEVRLALAELPIDLQELVLDRLDEIAADRGPSAQAGRELVSDLVHAVDSSRHYVFIVFVRDTAARSIRVRSIGHVVRSL